jgi:hypothetical protein
VSLEGERPREPIIGYTICETALAASELGEESRRRNHGDASRDGTGKMSDVSGHDGSRGSRSGFEKDKVAGIG